MIDEQILKMLVPETMPDLAGPVDDLETIEDEFHLRAEMWCRAIQNALPEYFMRLLDSPGSLAEARLGIPVIGIGFFPVPEEFSDERQANELSFGVVLYSISIDRAHARLDNLSINGESFPVVGLPVDFEEHGRLTGGRCSAVLRNGNTEFFLTANHCVSGVPRGNPVNVHCAICGHCETTTLEKRGHIYLDLALLRRSVSKCSCSYTSTSSVSMAARSMTVALYNSAPGNSQSATVLQGIGPWSAIINGTRPQVFTIDIWGSKGDSGCAIGARNALVGSYTRKLEIGTGPSTAVMQGFAHCADEALRLFNCNLQEGIF